jgi:hypothetical protein
MLTFSSFCYMLLLHMLKPFGLLFFRPWTVLFFTFPLLHVLSAFFLLLTLKPFGLPAAFPRRKVLRLYNLRAMIFPLICTFPHLHICTSSYFFATCAISSASHTILSPTNAVPFITQTPLLSGPNRSKRNTSVSPGNTFSLNLALSIFMKYVL